MARPRRNAKKRRNEKKQKRRERNIDTGKRKTMIWLTLPSSTIVWYAKINSVARKS
jgi:hypothetical protein